MHQGSNKEEENPINPTFQYYNAHDALARSLKDAILAKVKFFL
jgi:hypothetical protein